MKISFKEGPQRMNKASFIIYHLSVGIISSTIFVLIMSQLTDDTLFNLILVSTFAIISISTAYYLKRFHSRKTTFTSIPYTKFYDEYDSKEAIGKKIIYLDFGYPGFKSTFPLCTATVIDVKNDDELFLLKNYSYCDHVLYIHSTEYSDELYKYLSNLSFEKQCKFFDVSESGFELNPPEPHW